MCEKSIHHMETNKGNNVTLAEWHSRSPVTGPAAASGRPAVISSHMPTPLVPTHSPPISALTLGRLYAQKTRSRKPGLQTRHCLHNSMTARSGFLRYWCLLDYKGKKKKKIGRDAPPPPAASLKKLCPLPRLTKALPSCCHFNMRAPLQKKKASGTRLSNKDS